MNINDANDTSTKIAEALPSPVLRFQVVFACVAISDSSCARTALSRELGRKLMDLDRHKEENRPDGAISV